MKGSSSKNKRAFELRVKDGLTWAVIAIRLGYDNAAAARQAVMRYAKNG